MSEREALLRSNWLRAKKGVGEYLSKTGAPWAQMLLVEDHPRGWRDYSEGPGNSSMTVESVALEIKWLDDGTRWCRLPLFRACDVFCEGVNLGTLSGL